MTSPAAEPARRVLVLWNRGAGSKAGLPTNGASEEDLRRVMAEHGLGDELRAPESEEDARACVRDAVRSGYDVVVAAGGDGTVGLVANELLGSETALGIFPLGSAMNVGRSLGVPRDLGEAAAIVAAGNARRIDVGRSEGGPAFYEVASVGLSARLFGEAQRIDDGEYTGLLGIVSALARFRAHRLEIELDGRTVRRRAIMVAVAVGPYTGLGLTLAPGARLDDGRFDVAVYGRFLRWELVRHLFGILAGRRRYSPKITTYRAARVTIRARTPQPVRADADDLGTTPVTFSVLPAALRVVAPAVAEGDAAAGARDLREPDQP